MSATTTEYLTASVTERHISSGKRGDCFCCPIALAAHEQAGYRYASVGMRTWTPDRVTVELPDDVTKFIKDFDAGRPVTPATFRLPLPAALTPAPAGKDARP